MAASIAQRCSSSTSTSSTRRAEVAHGVRSAARPFTAHRPAVCSPVVAIKPVLVAAKAPLHVTRVAAAEQTASATATQEWHAIVCNSEFFFNDVQNESIAEQLRERVRFFHEQGKEADFYLVPDPVFLDKKFPDLAKRVKRPCIALVSTDKMWITFMKLRIDRVAMVSGLTQEEATQAGGVVPDFKAPAKWTAPYAPYSPGWYKPFLPPGAKQ